MIRMTVVYHNGRSRPVQADAKHTGGPLQLSSPLPRGAVIHPASIDAARQLIAHLEETIRLMTLPKPGPKGCINRNTPLLEIDDAEE